jgi:hypothetical protein
MTVEQDALRRQYGNLFASISEVLPEADPMRINFESNSDEQSEVATIIPPLGPAQSTEDVQAIIYEEFCCWFDGPREKYAAVSAKIWTHWLSFGSQCE